jgi:hypothetical protein
VVVLVVVVTVTVVVVGVGTSLGLGGLDGFDGLGFACLSGFASPCLAWDGGTAGVAGVAGLEFGGFADVAGIAGVALSWVSVCGFGFGAGAGADGSGALTDGGVDGVPPAVLPPLDGGCVGDVGDGVVGVGAGVGVPGDGEGPGVDGVPPPPPDGGAGVAGPCPPAPPEPDEAKIGVKPPKIDGAVGVDFTTRGVGETKTGTLRTWLLGTASSRLAERSLVVKACIQSWADATVPAATAPT